MLYLEFTAFPTSVVFLFQELVPDSILHLDFVISCDEQAFFIVVELTVISFVVCIISSLFQIFTLPVFSSKCFKSLPFMPWPGSLVG